MATRKQRKWHSPLTSGTYSSWSGMRGRCLSPNNVAYKYYGALGIGICAEWVNDYDQFYMDMGERPAGMTLERNNSKLGYSPGNCRWATRKEQANNQRRSILVSHGGKTLTLSQWATELEVPYYTLWNRIGLHKMEPAKALVKGSLISARRHGTNSKYVSGCRCVECVSAGILYRKEKRNEPTT